MRRCLAMIAALALALAFPATPDHSGGHFPWADGQRVVFLGDSITQAGHYIEDLEAYLYTRFPDRKYDILNLGLSAETASGLNEPGIGQPRPEILERLDRILQRTRPNLVFVCYGMNDGIYHPPDPERLRAYQSGMNQVIDRIQRDGADCTVLTPPPFDPRPILDRVRPIGARGYSYHTPFSAYDTVLNSFSDWLVSKRSVGWSVIDLHGALNRAVDTIVLTNPGFTISPDGVHPDASGHWLMAQEILRSWNVPAEVDSATINIQAQEPPTGSIAMIRDGARIKLSWKTRIPMPHDPEWNFPLDELVKIDDRFNRHRLAVKGLESGRYTLLEDRGPGQEPTHLGSFGSAELARGLNLIRLPELSTNRRATRLRERVVERHRLLNLAWVEAIGHVPPRPENVPTLSEAQEQARILEAEIKTLARPTVITLTLAPETGK